MSSNTTSFSEMEISAIGEILNISMGSAATAISKILDRRVDITTPNVTLLKAGEITIEEMEPAVGVSITYVEGISGSNVMVLKQADVNAIINIMTAGMLGATPDAELDEMSLSAICEVMNQMMGASSTALADFLGRPVNISTPEPVTITAGEPFLTNDSDEPMVVVKFDLVIEDIVNSQFLSVMTESLAREMLVTFNQLMGIEEAPQESAPVSAPQPAPPVEEVAPPVSAPVQAPPPPEPPRPAPQPAPAAPRPVRQSAPRVIASEEIAYSEARPVQLQSFDESENYFMDDEQPENLDLIRSVPLEVSVEIGKASRKVKEILEFVPGTVIELDKQAGAPVDIIVNGQPIAKGDVVVIGDNFGVRIVEILKREELLKL